MLDDLPVAFPKDLCHIPVGNQHGGAMKQRTDVLQGRLALMVLKTLDVQDRCTAMEPRGASSRSAEICWP
jgi:hypothetical protein